MFNRCLTEFEPSIWRRSLKCEGWFATCSRRIAALLENFEPSDMVNSLLHEWVGRLSVTGKTKIGLLLEKNKKLVFLLDTPPRGRPPLSAPSHCRWRLPRGGFMGFVGGFMGQNVRSGGGLLCRGPWQERQGPPTLHRRKAGIQTTHDSSSTFVAH